MTDVKDKEILLAGRHRSGLSTRKHSGLPLPVFLGQTAGYQQIAGNDFKANSLFGNAWRLPTRYGNCRLTHLCAYIGAAAGNVRLGIYNDNGSGAPGTLVAETGSFVPSANQWNRVAVPGTPTLTAGNRYWLVANPSSNTTAFATRPGSEGGYGFRTGSHTFGALPGTFPSNSIQSDDNHCFYAKLESLTLSKPADPVAPSVPAGIVGEGYTLAFQDEFEWFNRENWTNQVWWDGTAQYDSQYCESSVLKLVSRQGDGYSIAGGRAGNYYTDGWPHNLIDTVGMPGLDTFRQGYFECRMRSTGSDSDYPAFWLFATDWAKQIACPGAEIDVVELWGENYPTVFSGTIHSNSAPTEYCSHTTWPQYNNVGGGQATYNNGFDDLGIQTVGAWRTYAVKWETDNIAWYVDNVLRHQVPTNPYWLSNVDVDYHLLLYQWPWTTDLSGQPSPGTTPSELVCEVDWVRVWTQ